MQNDACKAQADVSKVGKNNLGRRFTDSAQSEAIGYFGGHSDTAKQTQKTKTTQSPDKSVTAEATPVNGTIKDDMIYIIGFGWVENEGGGGEGTYDHEMKTNGNKIGCLG